MKFIRAIVGGLLLAGLAACGGGGGSAGTTSVGSSGTSVASSASGANTTSASGSSQSTTQGSMSLEILNGAGVAASTISSIEQGKAVATVKDATGAPLSGLVVTYSEADATLLSFAPAAKTALTDLNGKASLDIKATDPTKVGAVTVAAAVIISGSNLAAKKSVQITAGGSVIAPVPQAINFLDANPSDKAIVIKGAGGAGRSESATLRFRVVNSSNTPIQGAVINFSVSSGLVTLNTTQATSDADGVVSATVSSGTQPASVVVTAVAAANNTVTANSGNLSVSNGITIAGGLELVAKVYNVDGGTTGAETDISAFLRDAAGNLVPDGTVVSFTTDFGAVGSSSAGSCPTVNGTCSVKFRVQEPRGTGIATIVGSVATSNPILSTSIQVHMSKSSSARALISSTGPVATVLDLGSSCKDILTLYAGDADNLAIAAGSTITVRTPGKNVTATIKNGSPVLDSLNYLPTSFRIEIDATAAAPACTGLGAVTLTNFELEFKSPNGVTSVVPLNIVYKQ
jgi:Bacterial Ig-like domain (group 1)